MNYIIMDLEWNQSPHGKGGENPKLPFEIIEIGAVKLDENLNFTDEFNEIICPEIYQELHFKIQEVTHIDMDDFMRNGKSFPQVISRFFEWCGEDYIFCTWGSMDLTELQRNMDFYSIEDALKRPLFYYDVQKLYSLSAEDGKEKKALDSVVESLDIPFDRPFHRALDDAHYTALIMKRIDFKSVEEFLSVDYFKPPQTVKEEIHIVFQNYSKYVSKVYNTREEALLEKRVLSTRCYVCGRLLRKKIRWFSSNTKFYFCLAICPAHGYLKGKLRIKKAEDNKVYVVKTLKLVDEEGAKAVRRKQEDLRERRKERRKKEALQNRT